MRGRLSSRSAAVVLAGCVGLTVMAPGLALAADDPSSCVAGTTWDPATQTCQTDTSAQTTSGTAETAGTTTSSSSSSSGSSSSSSSSAESVAGTAGGATAQQNADGAAVTPGTGTNDSTAAARRSAPAGGAPAAGSPVTGTPTTLATPAALATGGEQIVDRVAAATTAGGITLPGPFAPGAGTLKDLLGDLPIPTEVPQGGFTNPREACAFLVGGLPIQGTPTQLASLGTSLSQFCTSLPTSFTGRDLDDLADDLADLLCRLPHDDHHPIPHEPPHGVPADWWGYWHRGYDVDCPELTYDEANAILSWDRSDPFRLDGDNDGEACEVNWHEEDVEYVEYVGYPVGGVATGDGSTDTGSTDTGASGVEVALAAAALSGLGATGLVLTRRFARQG